MTAPRTPQPGQPDRRALVEAFETLVKAEAERKKVEALDDPDRPKPRTAFWAISLAIIIAGSILLVTRPDWLFPRAPVETPEVRVASLRVYMYATIERIEAYRKANGKLPGTLKDAGSESPILTYIASGEQYTLAGDDRGIQLTYSSSTPAKEFLGDAYQIIRARRAP